MKLEDAGILLTGAAGGIASAMAGELFDAGARLLLTDLDGSALETVASGLGRRRERVITCAADITSDPDRSCLVMAAREARINVLINAAGINPFGCLEDQSAQQISLAVNVNLLAPILLCREMLPVLQAAPTGHIVNVGSSFGAIGFPCFATYSATKFGVRGFTEALRRELASTPISVHYVAPRATRTRLVTDRIKAMNEELKVGMDTPEQVARAVVDLLRRDRRERSLGIPERLYAKINGLFPGLVDRALVRQLPTIRRYATAGLHRPHDSKTAPLNEMETQS